MNVLREIQLKNICPFFTLMGKKHIFTRNLTNKAVLVTGVCLPSSFTELEIFIIKVVHTIRTQQKHWQLSGVSTFYMFVIRKLTNNHTFIVAEKKHTQTIETCKIAKIKVLSFLEFSTVGSSNHYTESKTGGLQCTVPMIYLIQNSQVNKPTKLSK